MVYQLTSGKAYDPNVVYGDASDARGHSEQLNTKVPPRIEHLLDIVVAEHDGYRTRQDAIRNYIFHGLYRDLQNGATVDPLAMAWLEAEASRHRTEMRKRLREEQTRDMETMREFVQDLIDDKDWVTINEELDRVALLSENMDLPAGIRERYAELWDEMSSAITVSRTREIRQRNKLTHSSN